MHSLNLFPSLISALALAILGLTACPSPSSNDAGGLPDANVALADAGLGDLSSEPAVDAGEPVESPGDVNGFGTITGDCGLIDGALLSQTTPTLIENAIDFADDPYDESDYEDLTEGGQEILDDGNAGGSSILSEVFAYEVLHRCEGATLLKTEMEVVYNDPAGKLTDLLVDFDGTKVGVSVTRAVGYPRDDPYTEDAAKNILEQKLQGVLDSTANVSAEDAWSKQILHIIAYADQHADSLAAAYATVDAALKSNTLVLVTVSHGDDEFLY